MPYLTEQYANPAGTYSFTNASNAAMVCFRIALSYIVGVKMGYGALGVWFAMLVDWLFRAAVYTWRFEKGKWENMARI